MCVPLMTYITVFTSASDLPSRNDVIAILSMFLCIFFGFAMSFNVPKWVATIFFLLSTLSMCQCILIAFPIKRTIHPISEDSIQLLPVLVTRASIDSIDPEVLKKASNDHRLKWFVMLLPPFPVIYALKAAQAIDNNSLMASLTLVNLLAKFIFSSR